MQPKLLRFLEQGEIMPVGETRPQRVDVRVIAATNADLEQRVAEGKFREDLYYRLTVIRIHVPPLRERREEIPHLCALFLREACERLGKPDVQLSAEALDLFSQHWWPGNVRQLRNEIQRAVALSVPGGLVGPEHLSPGFGAIEGEARRVEASATPRLDLHAGRRRRSARTRHDQGGPGPIGGQHLRNGSPARPHAPRPIPEDAPPWPGRTRPNGSDKYPAELITEYTVSSPAVEPRSAIFMQVLLFQVLGIDYPLPANSLAAWTMD